MTTSMPMTGPAEPPPNEPQPRGRLHSLTAMPTHLIELSPAFLSALRKVAPRVRRRRLPYLMAVAVVAFAVAVVAVPAWRQRAVAFGRHLLHRDAAAAVVTSSAQPVDSAPAALPAITPDPVAVAPAAVRADAAGSASPTAALSSTKPSQAPRKRQPRAPR